jgi:hypothetical protein
MDIERTEFLVREAISIIEKDLEVKLDCQINSDSNILKIFDSIDVVGIILETEALIEAEIGRYVPLASESSFDADGSPLLRLETWIAYVHSAVVG